MKEEMDRLGDRDKGANNTDLLLCAGLSQGTVEFTVILNGKS